MRKQPFYTMEEKMSDIKNVKKANIDTKKIYRIPEFKVIEVQNKYLIIAYETGNWIVLEDYIQMEIFKYLALEKTIEEVINKYNDHMDAVCKVLIQLEAKQFENVCKENIENAETMQIYLTNGCNLRCKHCYMYSEHKKEKELTLEEIKDLCNKFKSIGGKFVTLTGGEVSTREDFPEILLEIDKIGLAMHILSNGVNISDKLIEIIHNSNVERVQISLDGVNEETNALVRGKGAFELAMKTIDKMVRRGINVEVAVTPLYEVAFENKQAYIDFASELIEKYKEFNFTLNFSLELLEGRELSKEEVKRNKKNYMELMSDINHKVFGDYEEESFISNHNDFKIFNNCGYGRINVSATGDIFFCSRVTEVKKYANIRENSFEEIIELMNKAREISDISNLKPCNQCELKYICGGGCRVKEFFEVTQVELGSNNISIKPRKCSIENKNKLYELMIKCNERLYR